MDAPISHPLEPRIKAARVREGGVKLVAVRLLNYATNHVVCHVPFYALRHAWYRRVLGVQLGHNSGIHLDCYTWFFGPSRLRRDRYLVIGEHSRITTSCLLAPRGPRQIA